VSSPTDVRPGHAATLRLVAVLADLDRRAEGARALARHVGAEDLLVFLFDAEVGAYLPAPGFVQTLPGGRSWQAFLRACVDDEYRVDGVPFPTVADRTRAVGLRGADGAVLVLLGGTPRREALEDLALLLPLLAAVYREERTARSAQAQATLLRRAATDAQALADGLDAARRELQRLYGEVRAALESRDAFLAAVTHDLKTPLTAVLGYVQLLRRRVGRTAGPDTERLLEGLQQIELTGTRMRRQIDQLLDVARLQMGQPLELERRPTDLVALCRAACREHQVGSGRHRIRLEARVDRMVGEWDPLRLERLLDNLLGNAIKYSPAGGTVTVTVDAEGNKERDAAGWALLTVRDSGIGVPEADVANIFDRFYRAGNTSRQMTGSGIGLASARQIVQEHGGEISAASEEGTGSVFTVRLPLARVDGRER
jgi:signal transduction histidine kinase